MEQTNPETGVAQEQSPEDRVGAWLDTQPEGQAEEPEQPEQASSETEVQPEGQADEVTPDDIPEEQEAQPAVDAFEIVHNGQQHKLTREETIRYAQQGFDYTQKTQKVAEAERFLQAKLQQAQEVEQITPYLMQDRAQVAALEAQLSQYQNVDWVKVATDDPMGYPAIRAQFDTLERAYYGARGRYEQKEQAVKQHLASIRNDLLQKEEARLPELIPEWKDEAKRSAGKQAVSKYLQSYGIAPESAGRYLDTAFTLATAYKAAKYDELVKSKAEKVKQLRTAPPVTKPGAKSGSAKADKEMELRSRLKKTNSLDDAAAILFNRMK